MRESLMARSRRDINGAKEDLPQGILFTNDEVPPVELVDLSEPEERGKKHKYFPAPILEDLTDEDIERCKLFLDRHLEHLKQSHSELETRWATYEEAYRALPSSHRKAVPFEGSDDTVIPAIAMAVDPIQARLDTGVLKQEPVFRLKALKSTVTKYIPALESFIDFNQKHRWKLRQVAQPRLFEFAKLGTMVFKVVYDRIEHEVKTYSPTFETVKKKQLWYSGPRIIGIPLSNLMFSPGYQDIQDCPMVAERQRVSIHRLREAEAANKFANVDRLAGQESMNLSDTEAVREDMTGHLRNAAAPDTIEVYECWFDFDVDGDHLPERLVATYEPNTRTLLQLRYNWYFHQRKPYTVIPYTVTNDSPLGVGIAEMVLPFQAAITRWHQMASDNAYLANVRMFIAKKNSGIEEVPRIYAGRTFFVDDPATDFKPFQAGEVYPSTLNERQNLFGMMEKRTGVSDYLTGRESPIIGSRATATSTLALIQEGTKRVEEVLENIRFGLSEVLQNSFDIWIQYGTEDLEDIIFGDDPEIGPMITDFFKTVSQTNVRGAVAIDLSATDATGNKQVSQQLQLSIIQIMMQYFEKLISAGAQALQAQQQQPQLTEMLKDVMHSSRMMFKDLLTKYDIRNPDDYLPDLEQYLAPSSPDEATPFNPGGEAGQLGGFGNPANAPSVPVIPFPNQGARSPILPSVADRAGTA